MRTRRNLFSKIISKVILDSKIISKVSRKTQKLNFDWYFLRRLKMSYLILSYILMFYLRKISDEWEIFSFWVLNNYALNFQSQEINVYSLPNKMNMEENNIHLKLNRLNC